MLRLDPKGIINGSDMGDFDKAFGFITTAVRHNLSQMSVMFRRFPVLNPFFDIIKPDWQRRFSGMLEPVVVTECSVMQFKGSYFRIFIHQVIFHGFASFQYDTVYHIGL